MPDIDPTVWVGRDEAGGVPNPGRPDAPRAIHWSWEAIVAVERPRALELSPDGRTVVATVDRDSSDLWLLSVPADGATTEPPVRLTVDRPLAAAWDDGGGVWSPDGSRIAYTADGAVRVVEVTTGRVQRVCDGSSPVWIDADRLVIGVDRAPTSAPERGDVTALAVVDVADPWPRRLALLDGDAGEAAVSPDGARVAFTLFHRDDLNATSLHVAHVVTGAVVALVHRVALNVHGPAWSPDGGRLAITCEEPGWYEVHVVDVSTGACTQLTSDGADFADLRWSPDASWILATRTRRGRTDLVRVEVATGAVTALAAGGVWSSPRLLPDGRVLAVHESATEPPSVRIVDPEAHVVREVLTPAPVVVRSAPCVAPEHVTYASLDGRTVHGWLFRPAGASPDAPCAAVVQPHGGPTAHTGDDWDGVIQRFVERGYAWFALNPRGSTSYGLEFERANHGVWGVADTWDCLAAHDHLASLGWVDAGRVGIFGASYGSYLALHSVIDDPAHRFACAAAKYGDCDIVTSWAQGDLVARFDLERMMGHPGAEPDAYRAGSPVHRIESLQVPVLVAHGEHDARVHPAQAAQLVTALARQGATYEYVTYRTEGHGFLRADPFVHFHRRLERFLDWHLMARRPHATRPDPVRPEAS